MYVNNVEVANNNYGSYGAVDEDSAWKFSMGTASTALGGYLAEWAKWDVALTSTQRDQLAGTGDYVGNPYKPSDVGTPIWYCDMYDGFDCQVGGLTVTNSSATIDALHPVSYGSAPAKVTTPSPTDTATDQSITVDCSWAAASGATSYDVYFGTDSTPDETEFIGNQPGLTYDPGTLGYAITYYWRIDSKNSYGTTTGDVWSFTTTAAPITIVSYTTGTNTYSSQISIDKPASVQNSDLLLAFVSFDVSGTMTGPSGWTRNKYLNTTVGDDLWSGVYHKIITDADNEPSSYLWGMSGSGFSAGGILCIRGVNNIQSFDVAGTLASGENWNNNGACPSITTATVNAMYLTCFALTRPVTVPAAPSPTTLACSALNGDTGRTGTNVMVSYAIQTAAGATGDKLWTLATWDNTAEWHGYQIALRSDDVSASPVPAFVYEMETLP
jgi:hypothetical protein